MPDLQVSVKTFLLPLPALVQLILASLSISDNQFVVELSKFLGRQIILTRHHPFLPVSLLKIPFVWSSRC